MRGRRSRSDVGFRSAETRGQKTGRAGGSVLVLAVIALAVVALTAIFAAGPDRPAASAGAADSILMTLGPDNRPADWDAFFARHPLPDDAIRQRIRAANDDRPSDVVCVPLEAEGGDGCL